MAKHIFWGFVIVMLTMMAIKGYVFVKQSETMFRYGNGECVLSDDKYIHCK